MNPRDSFAKSKDEIEVVTLPEDKLTSKTPDNVSNSLFREYLSHRDPDSTSQVITVRTLRLGDHPQKFCSNRIRTAKYNIVTWAPKSLLYQFKRSANIYFLVISILSFMSFSPKTPMSMAGTFSAVLIFTMLKEAYEDFFRHKQDTSVNNTKTHRLNSTTGDFEEITSAQVKVMDLVKVQCNEQIPADIVLLSCSHAKGLAFVNTMNLDGETNLKEKTAHEVTKRVPEADFLSRRLTVQCDLPNPSLIKWNCNIRLDDLKWIPLSMGQLLLRGCVLKNTDWAVGMVVYTGHESKIMLNSKKAPSKMSNVLRKMNKMLYTVFCFQAFICCLFAGLFIAWSEKNTHEHVYLMITKDPNGGSYFIQILTFLVAYSHLIPISLYVALEIVKLALAYLISQDQEMYYAEDDRPASCRTSDLVEELGQVEFVFSDKTGTLTCNMMEFKECSINGVRYGGGNRAKGKFGVGSDSTPSQILETRPQGDQDRDAIHRFFTQLALCHSVFPTEDKSAPGMYNYQAASPDELALVQGSVDMGYVFCAKEDNRMILRIRDKVEETWDVLAEIPFDSNRKRMTLLLREPGTRKYLLMCKGADTAVLPRLATSPKMSLVNSHLDEFARAGLRTLLIAQKYIPEADVTRWMEDWNRLQLSNATNKEELMDAQAQILETNMTLLGVTAIEDKLQKDVPETISLLMKANIRVWVLTGDKQETALEIGRMCKLIRPDIRLIDLSSDTMTEFTEKLNQHHDALVTSQAATDPKSEGIKRN